MNAPLFFPIAVCSFIKSREWLHKNEAVIDRDSISPELFFTVSRI
jgi:hypothetical protein